MTADIESARKEVAEACRVVANAGLAEVYSGHVTVRVGDTMLCPAHLHPSGRGLESITPEHIVEVDLDTGEQHPPEEDLELPDEVDIHSKIFQARDDVESVTHTHPLHATALACSEETVIRGSVRGARLGEVPVHDAGPVLIHGDAEKPEARGEALAETLGNASAALIRGHGTVTVGDSIGAAVGNLYVLERTAKLQLLADNASGMVPFQDAEEASRPLDDEIYKWLRREFLDQPFE